jgi:large subunit ribosomal protein L21
MWCVIKVGDKQYRVAKDDVIDVDRLESESDTLTLDQVLLVADGDSLDVGTPYVGNVTVTAQRVEEFKNDKVYAFKMRRRKDSRTLRGHRQIVNRLKILDIVKK